mgnify:CR=1 FL=1
MIIASTYLACVIMVGAADIGGFGCLNPAIGMFTTLVMSFGGNSNGIKYFWIYLCFPFVGAILAIIFHEVLYKNVQEAIEEREGTTGDDGLLDKDVEEH